MKHIFVKNVNVPLILSFFISLILIIAAIAKIMSPATAFPDVDYAAGAFEIFLAFILVVFFSHWEVWGLTAMIFASWGGFAFFWLLWGIPCTCLGSWILLHPGISFTLDILFVGLSALMMRQLGVRRKSFLRILCFCLPIALIGFVIANYLNSYYI